MTETNVTRFTNVYNYKRTSKTLLPKKGWKRFIIQLIDNEIGTHYFTLSELAIAYEYIDDEKYEFDGENFEFSVEPKEFHDIVYRRQYLTVLVNMQYLTRTMLKTEQTYPKKSSKAPLELLYPGEPGFQTMVIRQGDHPCNRLYKYFVSGGSNDEQSINNYLNNCNEQDLERFKRRCSRVEKSETTKQQQKKPKIVDNDDIETNELIMNMKMKLKEIPLTRDEKVLFRCE